MQLPAEAVASFFLFRAIAETADFQATVEGGATVVPLDGRNKAAYYDLRFP